LLQTAPFAGRIKGMKRQLKDKQLRTLRFIYDYIKSGDYPPTRKEIAEALGISIGTAYDRIQYLFGRGYLRESETWQCGRNIALTEKGILACEGD
jgi:Mn-dependent DtxR family transcriptional regulator